MVSGPISVKPRFDILILRKDQKAIKAVMIQLDGTSKISSFSVDPMKFKLT